MQINNVFEVAISSNMSPQLLSTKFIKFGNQEKENFKFHEDLEMINSIKENMIHRIAYRDWKFVEYYLSEVINYCRLS